MAWAARLRFDTAMLAADTVASAPAGPAAADDSAGAPAVGVALERAGKKHLKMPCACHFVACLKFTQTSIRPGRLRAGSSRSMWFVVANRRLSWLVC